MHHPAPELEEEMEQAGLVRPSGAGAMVKGWIHPELRLGFEVVAEVPMDGAVEPARLRLVRPIGETALFRVICVEDLIADGIDQARILLSLHPDADLAYLERRIREESMGDYGVEDITH
ncbi:hypothetical protein [Novosphingobium sp. ZW T3_23]|uniref:hypothetical protein n=1 Tax=Novosphingobium sp. ZW T3_23 TaxID=3378084 RepID=UPI003853988D